MSEYGIEKVEAVPRVTDPTQPDDGTTTMALVAVVGTPIDGAAPVYNAALGYCIWRLLDTTAFASGYGNNYGNDFGGPP